jgi:hypothetical protein
MPVSTRFCEIGDLLVRLCFAPGLAGKYPPIAIAARNFVHLEASRLDSLRKNGMEWVKDLGRKNVEDLLTIIQWNEENVGLPHAAEYQYSDHP